MPAAPAPSTDLYAVLGVDASAGGDEIARAFRARAKQLHPDTNDAPGAADEFNVLVAAYDVLSNHRTRRAYDDGRRSGGAGAGAAPPSTVSTAAAQSAPTRWTPRRAWMSVVGGALVTVLGIGAAFLTWSLHARDARRRADFRAVTAVRVGNGDITFTTADGRTIRTREPAQHGEGSDLGPTVGVRYDPAAPTHVIVDASSVGRDITLAIVSVKLLIGGPVFVVLGVRRLRRRTRAPTAAR